MRKREQKVGETITGDVSLTVVTVEGTMPMPAPWDYGQTAAPNRKQVLGLVSGIHGNEVTSVGGLISFLQELDRVPPENIRGKIVAVPFANPVALERGGRCIDLDGNNEPENLNRSFPGSPTGSLADATAHALMSIFREEKADLVIDLHTMNMRSLPIVIVDRISMPEELERRVWQYADLFGLGVVYDFSAQEYEKAGLDASLSAKLLKENIPSFTVEVPGGMFSLPEIEETVRQGLWNMVYHMEVISRMWPGYNYRHWEHRTKTLLGCGVHARFPGPRSSRAGFFRPAVSVGKLVTAGQVIGKIFNAAGELVESVSAPARGLISDIIDASLVNSGTELFEMLVEEKK